MQLCPFFLKPCISFLRSPTPTVTAYRWAERITAPILTIPCAAGTSLGAIR